MENLTNIINICDRLSTYSGLDDKMQTLKRNFESLYCREKDVNEEVLYAESSSRKKRRFEVEDWLTKVERTKNELESIDREVSGSGFLGRFQLVNRVDNLIADVARLQEQGKFPEGLTLNAPDTRKEALLTTKLVGQAFQTNLEKIWEHLMKDEILIIGIWGMGGVGKTTLVTHIHNRVRERSNTFGRVYWVTVSQNPNILKLQDDIAREIHFVIPPDEKDERKRAAILSSELKRRGRFVLILDDVWNAISLGRVGIPVMVNGCKLIITSRSLEVCRRLNCHSKIKVEPLSGEEAWELFEKNLRHDRVAISPQVLEVAKCVARECAGLPLGIITVARCMRGVNDIREWRDALEALKASKVGLEEMEEEVFRVLKFSYDRLNDPQLQQCFLYCALYPEDFKIRRDELIQCFIDEGFIAGMSSREAEFDRGHTILNKLVKTCLLEADGFDEECVKMHDLVRDMAINMSPQLMVRARMGLNEIPDEQGWSKDLERVSLMNNQIEQIQSGGSPRCPKLLTLLLNDNRWLMRIENSFFDYMPALQHLDLSRSGIKNLPKSIVNLKKLNALVLRECWKLQCMPSLAETTSLKRLDLCGSGIRKVPDGLERLVNLKYLDLRCRELEVFPVGILPKLCRLEYLKFDSDGSVKIKGEELRRLERLTEFEGQLQFPSEFYEYVMCSSSGLYQGSNCSYRFRVNGDEYIDIRKGHCYKINYEDGQFVDPNSVRIRKWSSISKRAEHPLPLKELLLNAGVQSLKIERCNDARSLCDISGLDMSASAANNVNLKECWILGCEGIECVGSFSSSSAATSSSSSSSSSPPLVFKTLEKLELVNLRNLSVLFELDGEEREAAGHVNAIASPPPSTLQVLPLLYPPPAVFSSLRSFKIFGCNKIKKLFQPGFLPHLQNLEEIKVWICDELEEIIIAREEEDEEGSSSTTIEYALPKLRTLSLGALPKLKSICGPAEMMACDALEEIRVQFCPNLKRIPLSLSPFPSSLQSIKVWPKQWWESVEWDLPNAKNRLQPLLSSFETIGRAD